MQCRIVQVCESCSAEWATVNYMRHRRSGSRAEAQPAKKICMYWQAHLLTAEVKEEENG